MKKSSFWAAVFPAALGVLLLAGCGGPNRRIPNRIQVGVACYNQSDTFISELMDSFKHQLTAFEREGLTATVTLKDAAGLQRIQNDQVRELLDEGCNILCVNLVDRTDPSEIIDLARENDVSIIFFNREPVHEDMMQWSELYYVGADAQQSGVMQGELAAEAIHADPRIDRNRDGKIQYVVLEGEAGHQGRHYPHGEGGGYPEKRRDRTGEAGERSGKLEQGPGGKPHDPDDRTVPQPD